MRNKTRIIKALLAAAAAILLIAGPAGAATASGGAVLIYPASYFADIQLNTAYDMIERVPGFVFTDTDTSKRGFASGAGNVLIDGARPASKTDTLSSVLQRVTVSQIDRIEVIRGGAPGIDMQGLSIVANVILKKADHTQIITTFANTFYGDGHLGPSGSVEFNSHAGDNVYDLMLKRINSINDDSAGNGLHIVTPPGGAPQIGGSHRRGSERVGYDANGSLARPLFAGDFAANFTLQETKYNSDVFYDAPNQANFPSSSKTDSAELGLNWDRRLGEFDFTLVGLQRFERDRNFNLSISPGASQLFNSVGATTESILRGTARYIPSQALMLEAGVEGAYNTLKGNSTFISNGTPVALPGSNPQVDEKRGEAFLQASWQISQQWSLEAGTRAEFSTIEAAGVPSRSFTFLKPRALLSWSLTPDMQLRGRVERVVGQLDFSNFIASSNFSNNGVSAGNLAIRPDQHWQYEGDYEFHFWSKGALVLSYTHEDITDLVDYIPIGNGLDGPGNIHKATNDIYDVEGALPLDRIGLTDTTIKPSLVWKYGAVADPVTGQIRQISGQQDKHLMVDILQDVQSWHSSFDLTVQSGFTRPYFRIAQVTYDHLYPLYMSLSWDYKPTPDWDVQLQLDNIVPYQFGITEYNYTGPRDVSPLANVTQDHLHSQARVFLQLRKTF